MGTGHYEAWCETCSEPVHTADFKIKNVEEAMNGADHVTFDCPFCKTEQKSYVVRVAGYDDCRRA